MLKKILACSVVAMFALVGSYSCFAAETGPAEITIVDANSKKPKPAVFPHKKHQDAFACAECHHGMADGKQTPYVEGQEIKKCETCHNSEVLAGKTSGKDKLDTLKGAGHANCKNCHTEVAKKDPAKADLKKCSTCHPK